MWLVPGIKLTCLKKGTMGTSEGTVLQNVTTLWNSSVPSQPPSPALFSYFLQASGCLTGVLQFPQFPQLQYLPFEGRGVVCSVSFTSCLAVLGILVLGTCC